MTTFTENEQINDRLRSEVHSLFQSMWHQIKREEDRLNSEYNLARNLACSEWTEHLGMMMPTKIIPERLDLLQQNFEMLRSAISRQRYFLLKAFQPLLVDEAWFDGEQQACYDYWEEELAKAEPELCMFKQDKKDV